LPCVSSDNYQGAYDATRHLLEHGHTSIAFVQGIPDSGTNVARVGGYKAALKDYGVPFRKTLVVGDGFGEEDGYAATRLLLERKDVPTAIFLASNLIALGALRAFAEDKINVPDDISIVSFDDQHYSPYLATPMTTIAQQRSEMGRVAVELLLDQLEHEGRHKPEVILLPTGLIPRQSVRDLQKKTRSKTAGRKKTEDASRGLTV
jgi:LacI family transcriptional regulator